MLFLLHHVLPEHIQVNAPSSPSLYMEATAHLDGERRHDGMLIVLQTLEKAARTPNVANFNQLELNEVFRMENWTTFQNVYGDDKDPFANNDGQVVDAAWADRLLKSTVEIDNIIKISHTLLNVATDLQSQLNSSQERVIAAKRSKGIKSLPDELVARIFQIAVWEQYDDWDITEQAVSLSKVSRRFYNVALGTRSLWTMLGSFSSRLELETLIARAGPNEGFHVSLYINPLLPAPKLNEISVLLIGNINFYTAFADRSQYKAFADHTQLPSAIADASQWRSANAEGCLLFEVLKVCSPFW
ncbi:hypothetical protein SCHPADRAFT_1001056 [Schizopora paradoxa]|uniref:Uncharacterized protein n=1 Tax=Schizopora paradoxa TaxID=27342 RepID=A0A0H2RFI7_9AGAM|nr:hypothetical protein SCHPADRAFT_1001056 [Schizopora paradoxa]